MNEQEARSLLQAHLAGYRRRSHAELSATFGHQGCTEVIGSSGAEYQIEVDIMWNWKPGGELRVIAAIDDGRGWGAIAPLTQSFVISPDGTTR